MTPPRWQVLVASLEAKLFELRAALLVVGVALVGSVDALLLLLDGKLGGEAARETQSRVAFPRSRAPGTVRASQGGVQTDFGPLSAGLPRAPRAAHHGWAARENF